VALVLIVSVRYVGGISNLGRQISLLKGPEKTLCAYATADWPACNITSQVSVTYTTIMVPVTYSATKDAVPKWYLTHQFQVLKVQQN